MSVGALLDQAIRFRDAAAQAERDKLIAVAAWADAHTTGALMPDLLGPLGLVDDDAVTAASSSWLERYGMPGADAFLDLAGPGAPEVSHFAVVELAAGPVTVNRLVLEAAARLDPEETEGTETDEHAGLYVNLDLRQLPSTLGTASTVPLDARLDRGDTEELDAALSALADQQAADGSPDDLDVRRAKALGYLARGHWTLDLTTDTDTDTDTGTGTGTGTGQQIPTRRRDRQVVLHVHRTDAALTGTPQVDPVSGTLGLHFARPTCAFPPTAPAPPEPPTATSTSTTPSNGDHQDKPNKPGHPAGRPRQTTSRPCAGPTTAPRPTPHPPAPPHPATAGPTDDSQPAPGSGPAPTTAATSSTPTAPPPSDPEGTAAPSAGTGVHPTHRSRHPHSTPSASTGDHRH